MDNVTLLTPDRDRCVAPELCPNREHIAAHLAALFAPTFVHPYQDSWIEIVYGDPDNGNQLNRARKFSAHNSIPIIDFAERKNAEGCNVYVGAALRKGDMPPKGRANDVNFQATAFAWADYDAAGDDARIGAILQTNGMQPALVVTTGTVPHVRRHLYFAIADGSDQAQVVAANTALMNLLGSDDVRNASRIMRLAGTVNYPTPAKMKRNYIPEPVTLIQQEGIIYRPTTPTCVDAGAAETNHFLEYAELHSRGTGDADLQALLASAGKTEAGWHKLMLKATGVMIGRGYDDFTIKTICAPHCDGGFDDADIPDLIDRARIKWNKPEGRADAEVTSKPPLIVSSANFLKDFVPPDYLLDGILQKHFIYSMTALTGNGKSAVALMLAVHVALGRPIGERFVEKGRVLYLAGENPDDIRMRWLASAEKMGFDADTIEVHFLPGVFKLSRIEARIRKEIEAIGPVALIIVDTSAAYFEGDDENGNVQMGDHARFLRTLVTLPGAPCVLVACHPVKNAAADNLLPRGGGAFLNEMDGNLTCAKIDSVVKVDTQGKFRGPEFAPLYFGLYTAKAETLKDSRGRLIPTVVAMPISEAEQQQAAASSRNDEDEVLTLMADGNTRSLSGIAAALHWQTKAGKPNKVKVQRAGDRLKASKLADISKRGLALTAKGKKEADKIEAINTPSSAPVGDTKPDRTPKF